MGLSQTVTDHEKEVGLFGVMFLLLKSFHSTTQKTLVLTETSFSSRETGGWMVFF